MPEWLYIKTAFGSLSERCPQFLYHKLKRDNGGIFQITGLPVENLEVYKAKKFACKSLKGSGVQSGIRVVYAYDEEKDKIVLIEMYFKGDKARIFEYLR